MEKGSGSADKCKAITEAFFVIIVLQAALLALKKLSGPLVSDDWFWQRMKTACAMLLLTAVVYVYAALRRTPLSVFPHPFGKRYIVCTCLAGALLISAPSNFSGGYQPVLLTVYGSIVTPVFEELLFRGYLWNRLERALRSGKAAFLLNVVLFTVWHLGYMTDSVRAGNWNAVFWKLAAGFGYGVVLGLIRLRTKNCFSTILAHGILNLFMI